MKDKVNRRDIIWRAKEVVRHSPLFFLQQTHLVSVKLYSVTTSEEEEESAAKREIEIKIAAVESNMLALEQAHGGKVDINLVTEDLRYGWHIFTVLVILTLFEIYIVFFKNLFYLCLIRIQISCRY